MLIRSVAIVAIVLFGSLPAWAQAPNLEAERQKNFGVAYLEENKLADAARAFRRVIARVPGEALGYANLGLTYLRMGKADSASFWLDRARQSHPENPEVLLLAAEAQLWQGEWTQAAETARAALAQRPNDKMARYLLYRAASARLHDPEAQQVAADELTRLYDGIPGNLVVAVKVARLCAMQGDLDRAIGVVNRLRAAALDAEAAQRALALVDRTMAEGDAKDVRRGLTVLENVLRPTSAYKKALREVQAPPEGVPMHRFGAEVYAGVARERPAAIPVRFVPLDAGVLPASAPVALRRDRAAGSLDVADVDGDGREDVLVAFADGTHGALRLWFGGTDRWRSVLLGDSPGAAQARFVDYDNDARFEIALAGPGGLRLLQGDSAGVWRDLTAQAGLLAEAGAALALVDADSEGDLDLCVGTAAGLRLWQNRLDGTFREVSGTTGLSAAGPGVRQALALDWDDDLDTDLCVVDASGRVRLFDNLRQGRFGEVAGGLDSTACRWVTAPDVDNDGLVDVVRAQGDGSVRLQHNTGTGFAPGVDIPAPGMAPQAAAEFDFDNDGWEDLAFAGVCNGQWTLMILRNEGDGRWTPRSLDAPPEGCLALSEIDMDRDGDLDLLALDGKGRVRGWRNDGGNANHWLRLRLKGLRTAGTKNNLYGMGCKVELKAGFHYQARFVRRPVTHFGLGAHAQADLLRVMWSNGVPQNRFRLAGDQIVLEPQVLKGSCPNLYCWDGERFVFVTDLMGGAPLGILMGEGVVAPDYPLELMTISKHKIAPKDGEYVCQLTQELWETVYVDEQILWAVDHPADIEVFTDQRYLPPPYTPPRPILTTGRTPPVWAGDSEGREVTDRLQAFDHQYPETLRLTRCQGIVAPHTLTLRFGDVTRLQRPLLVIGTWILWTDTSINLSISQGKAIVPAAPALEVWHAQDGWREVDAPVGFPKGKDKWVVLDLSETLFRPDARVRLRTNYQIYWDVAFLADAAPHAPHKITRLKPAAADLHYGGFARVYRDGDGPHGFDYAQRSALPVWVDMAGFATRYGDVTDLVSEPDDCFAIMAPGDEMTVRFNAGALPPPPHDWVRDFLLWSDGWEKDGDKNALTGETVAPLPFHGMSAYPYPPEEAYPEDALHRAYRARYNTRRIGPETFQQFVRDYAGGVVPPLPWSPRDTTVVRRRK